MFQGRTTLYKSPFDCTLNMWKKNTKRMRIDTVKTNMKINQLFIYYVIISTRKRKSNEVTSHCAVLPRITIVLILSWASEPVRRNETTLLNSYTDLETLFYCYLMKTDRQYDLEVWILTPMVVSSSTHPLWMIHMLIAESTKNFRSLILFMEAYSWECLNSHQFIMVVRKKHKTTACLNTCTTLVLDLCMV